MGLLIFILPTVLITAPKGGIIVVLMLILSLLGLAINRDKLELNKWEKYFVLSFIFYFAVVAINLWWFDGKLRDLDTPSRLLLVLPIFFFIRKSNISIDWLIWGIVIGAILTGVIKFGFIDANYLSKISTIQTGSFSLFSSIFGLASLILIKRGNSHIKNTIFFVAFILGFLASMLSGGRGVWIALVFSTLAILFINPMNWSTRVKFIVVLLLSANFMGTYLAPETGVKNRVDLAVKNVANWMVNGQANTSAGARLEMWEASFGVIKENLIIGVGEDNYAKHQEKLVDQGEVDKFVGNFSHPHGEYITSLVEQGLIGLLAFLMVLIVPIRYALDVIRSQYRYERRVLISVVMVIALHYAFYSFTSGVFDHQSTALFYATFMTIILGFLRLHSQNDL